MKVLPAIVIAIAAAVWGCIGEAAEADEPPLRQLRRVTDNLPREPLRVTGDLTVRKRHGVVVVSLGFEMTLRWGDDPGSARYTLRDAFGAPLDRMTVTIRGGQPFFEYSTGNPPAPAPLPDLYAPIHGTDLTWTDLAMGFLWWPRVAAAGEDERRGRPCRLFDVHPPAPVDAGATTDGSGAPYARVRLWVDTELAFLLQAEAYNAQGAPVRRLWVDSVKKINDRWMVKDLEVHGFPIGQRTRLTVRNVEAEPTS